MRHSTISNTRRGAIAALAPIALVLSAPPLVAQAGGFVVTLGADTVQVESFTRTPTRLEGVVVTREPTTRIMRYTMTFGSDGAPLRFAMTTTTPDGTPLRGTGHVATIAYAADSLTRETSRNGEMVTERLAAVPGAVPAPSLPYIGQSILMYEIGLAAARRTAAANGESAIAQIYLFPGAASAPPPRVARTRVWFIGTDSVEMDYFGVARRGFRFDARGELVRADWSGTTYKYAMRRVAAIDVDPLVRAWDAADKRGAGLGVRNPVDSMRATVGGASVVVSYSRPLKRGRAIWGALVPWDAVWRFGADFATHITTTADLTIGAAHVPAGRYTLWMQPSASGQSVLIVSRLVNVFGTGYNPSQDLARIPLERSALAPAVERFTVAVEAGRFWVRWDDTAWSVPIAAR